MQNKQQQGETNANDLSVVSLLNAAIAAPLSNLTFAVRSLADSSSSSSSSQHMFDVSCDLLAVCESCLFQQTIRLLALYALFTLYPPMASEATYPIHPFLAYFVNILRVGIDEEKCLLKILMSNDSVAIEVLNKTLGSNLIRFLEDYIDLGERQINLSSSTKEILNDAESLIKKQCEWFDNFDTVTSSKQLVWRKAATQTSDTPKFLQSARVKTVPSTLSSAIVVGVSQLSDLIQKSCCTHLTEAEEQTLTRSIRANQLYLIFDVLKPSMIPSIIQNNPNIATEILFSVEKLGELDSYFNEILMLPCLSLNLMNAMNKFFTSTERLTAVSSELVYRFLNRCISLCEIAGDFSEDSEKAEHDRMVRLFCVFINSLIRNHAISLSEYNLELQSFCLSYPKIKECTMLFASLSKANR